MSTEPGVIDEVRREFGRRIEFGVFGSTDAEKDDMRVTVDAILDDVSHGFTEPGSGCYHVGQIESLAPANPHQYRCRRCYGHVWPDKLVVSR